MNAPSRRAFRFWPLLLVVLLTDCTTKRLAEDHLTHAGVPTEILGNVLRLTLTYNDGGALGIETGPTGLKILVVLSGALILGLALFYRRLPPEAGVQATALGLLLGGAMGNLLDRVRAGPGVVDFIDIGWGPLRFWTFNVADLAIASGALLLAWCMWRERDWTEPDTG
jgi:signal peptidase II